MRENRTSGSMRGALGNRRSYRERLIKTDRDYRMKWYRDRGTLGLILGILVAIAVAVFQSIGWERLLPLLAVVVLALIFLSLVVNTEDRITQEIDKRLPKLSYLDKRKEVELASLELVERASEFVIATGGRSRNIEYLKLIEKKVYDGEVLYWRIIYNEILTQELCDHLCTVISLPNASIAQIKDTAYGNMIITDDGMLVALPVPVHGELKAIHVPNSEYAQKMNNGYMMTIFSKAKKIDSVEDIRSLCETKQSEEAQQTASL